MAAANLENVFDQLVNRGAARGVWPVGAGGIVTQPSAADGFIDPVAGDLACVDPLVVIGNVPLQSITAIP